MSRVSEWEIERVWEWVRARVRDWESEKVSFEHRDENKSCSACQEWFNERLKECGSEKEWESERVRMRVGNIGKRKKTLKTSRFPAFVWRSDIFLD